MGITQPQERISSSCRKYHFQRMNYELPSVIPPPPVYSNNIRPLPKTHGPMTSPRSNISIVLAAWYLAITNPLREIDYLKDVLRHSLNCFVGLILIPVLQNWMQRVAAGIGIIVYRLYHYKPPVIFLLFHRISDFSFNEFLQNADECWTQRSRKSRIPQTSIRIQRLYHSPWRLAGSYDVVALALS